MARQLGVGDESLRNWIQQAEVVSVDLLHRASGEQGADAADRATSRVFTNTAGTKISAWESIGYDDNSNRTGETVTQVWPVGTGSTAPGAANYVYDPLHWTG